MPHVIQSTYREDYSLPNVDRYNTSKQYETAIKEDCEAQKKGVPPLENNSAASDVKRCEPEWTQLERMELKLHRKLFTDSKDEKTASKKKSVIERNNKFTEKIDKHLCVSPVGYQKCPGEFRTTYREDYPDLNPDRQSPYDNLTTRQPLQYTELGNIIVPEDSTIAEYTKTCAAHRRVFEARHVNEISNAIPSGRCRCVLSEYQDNIGRIGGILKKKDLDGLSKLKKGKKGKRTCGW